MENLIFDITAETPEEAKRRAIVVIELASGMEANQIEVGIEKIEFNHYQITYKGGGNGDD